MAYVSPQVEGRIKNQNTWTCQNCAFNENAASSNQCQYCGFLKNYNPNMAQPIIEPNNIHIPSQPPVQPYPPQNYNPPQIYSNTQQYHSQQQPSITQNITVNVNDNNNNQILQNNKTIPKENYDKFVNEQYEHVYDEYEDGDEEYKKISCGCATIRLFLWFTICGGLVTSIWWFICGIIYLYWCKQCLIISKYLLFGLFRKDNEIKIKTKCKCYDSDGANEKK
eukprot:354088_1